MTPVCGRVSKTAVRRTHLPRLDQRRLRQALPPSHNAFVYVYRGDLQIGSTQVPVQRMAILKNDADSDGVVLEAVTTTHALLIAGKPLGEPIAQYGLFVMNTKDEIVRAAQD